jgi:hypothetical protein
LQFPSIDESDAGSVLLRKGLAEMPGLINQLASMTQISSRAHIEIWGDISGIDGHLNMTE